MKCINHLDKDATAVCNHCGKSICQDCQVQMHGEVYCQGCATQSLGQQKAKPEHSPALAAILSFIIAGLGQIYNGQMGKGILIFLTGWLIIPWIIGIFDAYSCAKKIKEGAITVKSRPGCIIGFVVGVVVFYMGIFMIALLAAIAIPNLLRARISANEAAAEATLKTMATAIETYRVDKGAYPETEYSLNSYLSQAYPVSYTHLTLPTILRV